MVHLNIVKGRLKTSIEELNNELLSVNRGVVRLEVDDNGKLKGYIGVTDSGRYTKNNVLVILAKHCLHFKIEAKSDDFGFDMFADFIWDGRKMLRVGKSRSGAICYTQNWNWIFEN